MPVTATFDLAAAYADNPHDVAGFAGTAAFSDAEVRAVLGRIGGWATADGGMSRSQSAELLYGLLHVARCWYAEGGAPSFWPHLDRELGIDLGPTDRRRVGDMFGSALDQFGYSRVAGGAAIVGDVVYHCGVPDRSTDGLVRFADRLAADYGDAAADLAPLDLAALVPDSFPGLHAGVRTLLQSGRRGVGPLWAVVTRAVAAHRADDAERRDDALRRLPAGVSAAAVRAALERLDAGPPARTAALPVGRRPRVRYEFDTGSVRVWVADGQPGDWAVSGADGLRWDETGLGCSACLLRPPAAALRAERAGREFVWHTRPAGFPGLFFHAVSGRLIEAGDVADGLDPGPVMLVLPGTEPPAAAERQLLGEWAYLAAEPWSAWLVTVPARADGRTVWEVAGHRLGLARRPVPPVLLPDPAAWADTAAGERVPVFAAPPDLTASGGRDLEAVFVGHRSAGLSARRGVVSAHRLGAAADQPAAGLYEVRRATGVGLTLARYAVLPGLRIEPLAYTGDRVQVRVHGNQFGGRWAADPAVRVDEVAADTQGWHFHAGTDRPSRRRTRSTPRRPAACGSPGRFAG